VIATTLWEAVAAHAGTFLVGVLVGLLTASRYLIVRTNGRSSSDDAR
jgi:hypothetical protein